MVEVASSSETGGNPLLALAVAIIHAILYVLQSSRAFVAWLTITLPIYVVRMLQYSFTISLTFPILLSLFLGAALAFFLVIRYRYLARYTQLKEPALPPPSPPSLAAELLPIAPGNLGDLSRGRTTVFHNYLDDFLSAIRIFGYLEKPVFHELSRHLQTRRLAAGDSTEIGTGEFWCVVEGNVQVFAPASPGEKSAPPTPDDFGSSSSSGAFNGYLLLNEVSTGGTLSSLFSILTLFTEDIRLSWNQPESGSEKDTTVEEGEGVSLSEMLSFQSRKKDRQDSDVSQLDGSSMGRGIAGLDENIPEQRTPGSSTSSGTENESVGDNTLRAASPSPPLADPSDGSESLPTTTSTSPNIVPTDRPNGAHSTSMPTSPRGRASLSPKREPVKDHLRDTRPHASAARLLDGTIARATVDTTLAVIPAEAFRKLTRKFPKASGTVVQVVLERFSRVTFMTAHKFLGLTREILRSESSLNHLVSHPLPRSFYTGGGMQSLRARFESPDRDHADTLVASPISIKSRDYFNYAPSSPTVRAPSLPSATSRHSLTPAATRDNRKDLPSALSKMDTDIKHSVPAVSLKATSMPTPDAAARNTSAYVRRASAIRKEVAAGDLAMSNVADHDNGGSAFYRSGAASTPGLPRIDTWRGRFSGSTTDLKQQGGTIIEYPPEVAEGEFELPDAVMLCIAQSIGLTQPPPKTTSDNIARSSVPPSISAMSTPNSPMFPPHGKPSPFGNVLDMMNASNNNDNILGGMLREAVMNARLADDDMSSVSASVHDSQIGGKAAGVDALRDLEGKVEISFFRKGSTLVKEGERSPGIYYVIDGFLEVSIPVASSGVETPRSSRSVNPNAAGPPTSTFTNVSSRPFSAALGHDIPGQPQKDGASGNKRVDEPLFTVKPGGIAGYLASLCSTDSYVNITAKTDAFVGFLPNSALQKIIERKPIVLLTLAKRLLSLLSPLVLHIDAALDWQQLSGGQVLYEKGAKATDFYIVINGRLRALNEKETGVEVIREYGQNDSIGELDVITGAHRSDTVHAIRDSELVRIPAALFDAISVKHPQTTVQFMRIIAGRVRRVMGEHSQSAGPGSAMRSPTVDVNFKTVCVLGSNRSVPVAHFAGKLKTSLEELGASTSYLDQQTVMRHLGRHAFAPIGKLKIAGWLADQEQHFRTVLYVADTPPSSQWTLTCIRQADLILILGMGDEPALGDYEKLLLVAKTTARKELILLHDERTVAPGSTRPWLKNRPWIHTHHHVELPGVVASHKAVPTVHDPAAIAAFKHLRERVETQIKRYKRLRPFARPRRPPHMDDFARIARRLCGKQIGLVLGGGGARGISHIGMLQALEEFGIPIDAIGGCSIGAFVGGLYARETDLLETTGRTKQFAGRMGSLLRMLSDVTYPFVAYTTGHEFNRGIYKAFYNTHIEDFWIPFFANSTNITHSRMEIHRSGYAWRYVRASMTLAGLLPPLSDNGDLLVDGGYMDNTPIGPLRANGIRNVIVVDVGSVDDTSPRNYGDSVSGWWIFLNKFNPFYQRTVLSMTEISSRLAYVSSVKTLEDVKNDPNCLFLAMPVQEFDTLGGFKQFSKVLAVGVRAGREALKQWKEDGKLPTGLVDEDRGNMAIQRGARLRRMSI